MAFDDDIACHKKQLNRHFNTYAQFFENIHEYLILLVLVPFDRLLLTVCWSCVNAAYRSRDRCRRCRSLLEDVPRTDLVFDDFLLLLLADLHWLADGVLSNVLSGHQLRMTIVDNLIDDLVDQHKVLPYALFVQHAAIVTEHLHHSINDVHHERGRYVVLRSRHKVDSEFLRKEVIQSLYVLRRKKRFV